MFAPTKVFRKWHSRVPRKVRRLAVRAALAASAIPALVMARGHNLEDVPEIPLVVPNSVEALEKTKDAVKLLKDIGGFSVPLIVFTACFFSVPRCAEGDGQQNCPTRKGKVAQQEIHHSKGPAPCGFQALPAAWCLVSAEQILPHSAGAGSK